jgi:hypothetical protein
VACEGLKLLPELVATRQSQPAPFQIHVIARKLGVTLELGVLRALLGAPQALAFGSCATISPLLHRARENLIGSIHKESPDEARSRWRLAAR